MKRTTAPLMLASGSPRRRELLASAGFEFEIQLRNVDESLPDEIPASEAAIYLAEKKSGAYHDLDEDFLIITADTVVVLGDEILNKPEDESDAIRMIRKLSGKSHEVITGVCFRHKGKVHPFSERTTVSFRNLMDEEIAFYVDEYRPMDKAGAYGIQEWIGLVGIERIEGDYNNVVGLPVCRIIRELEKFEP